MEDQKPQNIQELMDQYHEYKNQAINYSKSLSKYLIENDKLRKENETYKKQIADLSTIKKGLSDSNSQLQNSNQEKTKQIQQLELKYSLLEKYNHELLSEINQKETLFKDYSEQLDELIKNFSHVEDELIKVQKENEKIGEIVFEPNMYLKAKFIGYDLDANTIKVMIENENYFYSLSQYDGEYLPIYNSRLLIFRSDENIKIFGFNNGKIIPEAKKIKAIIKSILPTSNELKIMTQEYGLITVTLNDKFKEKFSLRPSETVMLKQVYIDGDYYYTLIETNSRQYDSNKILNLIKGKK